MRGRSELGIGRLSPLLTRILGPLSKEVGKGVSGRKRLLTVPIYCQAVLGEGPLFYSAFLFCKLSTKEVPKSPLQIQMY